jgi:leucyl/phenylalanyl-tRNA--protein transferase
VPVEPPPNVWDFPPAEAAGDDEIVAVGADLEPGTILEAYRRGLFPMRVRGRLAWWSPDPRAVIPLDGFHASRSLQRARRRGAFSVRVDAAFEDVMRACAAPDRPHGWIDESFVEAYARLHVLGWAHSVEAWHDGELVGGVYGLRIGRFFAGESMFHRVTDASKVALWATVDLLALDGAVLFDVQWLTPHLESLGAIAVSRTEYLSLLASAVGKRQRSDRRGAECGVDQEAMTDPVQIFHNPSCSKSRGALQILEERGVDPNIVRYLDTPPDRATLERILDAIDAEPVALVRTGDPKFKAAGLTKADVETREQVIDVLLKHPEVMERPVVFVGDRAVIARPSERVLDLLG